MRLFSLAFALVLYSAAALAQSPLPHPQYIFFSNLDRAATEQKINDYAAQGYRLAALQPGLGHKPEITVAMADLGIAPENRYEYKLLGGEWFVPRSKRVLMRDINTFGSQGYRLLPWSLLIMDPRAWHSLLNETAVAMERVAGTHDKFEYRDHSVALARHLSETVESNSRDGFFPIFVYPAGNHLLLFEKSSREGSPGDVRTHDLPSNRLLATSSPAKLSFEFLEFREDQAREKFELFLQHEEQIVFLCSGTRSFAAMVISVPGSMPSRQLWVEAKADRGETIFPAAQLSLLEDGLNEAAGKGYALSALPMSTTSIQNFTGSKSSRRLMAPMQFAPGARRKYRIISAESLPELSDTINRAAGEGWQLFPGAVYASSLAFLEKVEPEAQP